MKRKTLGDVVDHAVKVGFRPKTIIDVGVAYGTPGLYGKVEGAEYLLVEPLREYEETCRKIVAEFGGRYLIAAAAPQAGELEINVHPDLSGSSLLKESEGSHVDGEPRMVPTVRLDQTCAQLGLAGPYLLKLDTQGSELSVLEGATGILAETEMILTEVSLFAFYRNSPILHEVIDAMKRLGFVVYDVFGGAYRPYDDALGQIDLAFVRERGFFRQTDHWATREQREKITRQRIESLNPKK